MTDQKSFCWSEPHPTGHLNVGLILKNAAIAYPDKKVVDATTGTIRSFRVLNERANRIANGFLDWGKERDSVAVMTRWGIETIEVYFACARAGMVFSHISYRLAPNEVENILRYANTKAIIFDEEFRPIIDKINHKDLKLQKYIIGKEEGEFASYDSLLKYDEREPNIDITEDMPLMLGFTSGTTGVPKAYIRTHYANFFNHLNFVLSFDLTSEDVGLTAIPPFTGLTCDCGYMLAMAEIVNLDFDPVNTLKAIEKYKVTIMYGVPAMYSAMMDVADFDKYDLSSLRGVISVGAAMPLATLERIWNKLTPNCYEMLGTQEAGYVAVIKPDMKRKKPESVGSPARFNRIRIVDEEGKDKPAGEIGEVLYQSPDGAGAYWRNEKQTEESFGGGWFHTKDLGRFDDDGYLYISGRTKDMIISGGYNVFAKDVEDVIMSLPEVADCAVIGLPDEKWGEKVVAVVQLKEGEALTAEEVKNYCGEKMATYKTPKSIFLDSVLRSTSGKAIKHEMISKYEGK